MAIEPSNPLNHAPSSDDEVRVAMGSLSDSNPTHHTRHSDSDARSTIAGEGLYWLDTTVTLTIVLKVTHAPADGSVLHREGVVVSAVNLVHGHRHSVDGEGDVVTIVRVPVEHAVRPCTGVGRATDRVVLRVSTR